MKSLMALAFLVGLALVPVAGDGAESRRRRIVDESDPRLLNPLKPHEAEAADGLERTVEQLSESQEKLRAGRLSREEYDKSIAEATHRVAEVATKHPDSAAVQSSAARAYLQAGDLGKAVVHASQAMALAPNDPFPLTTRGLAYFEGKDFPKAAEDARRALEVAPKDPVAHALYMLSKDRPAGGSSAAILGAPARPGRESIALPANPYVARPAALRPDDDPEIARYKTEEGRNYARQVIATEKAVERKDYLTAFGLANGALATYADNPRVLAARAVAAWNLRDFRTAVSDATLVLKAKPDMQPMLIARAAAYNDMGRHAVGRT